MPFLGTAAARPGHPTSVVTDWSVDPDEWGEFLCRTFDLWCQNDFGNVLINWFESLVGQWMKQPARICTLAEVCRRALAVEKDGSLYPCDHFVYPECRLGDLRDKNRELADVAYSPSNEGSAAASATSCPTTADTARIASPATATVPRIDSSRPPTASPDSVTFVPASSDLSPMPTPRSGASSHSCNDLPPRDPLRAKYHNSLGLIQIALLGRAHDVLPPALLEEGNVLRRDHATVPNPDPIGPAITAFHRLDNLLERGESADSRRRPRIPRASRTWIPPGRCRPACSPADGRVNSRGGRVDWPRPGPRNTCWSRRTTTGRTPVRTARPADSSRTVPTLPCAATTHRVRGRGVAR